ncbi:MAG: sugar ABC transporter permease [Alphaproteobacteria bacterium]|nr:sugar ABC transporter permease [Alphaproteobacteria bacterium]MBN9496337.1 sugar ABC transporter permease [Alphaproteobacteria bacterium]
MVSSRLTPYYFLAPAILATAAIVLYPVASTLWMSFHDFVLFRPHDVPFTGLRNYQRLLADEAFWISLWNSFVWVGLAVGLQFALGMAAALILNESFAFRSFARALVVVPWALPSVIIGLMFTWVYDYNLGLLNDMLLRLGFIKSPVAWLADPDIALYAVIVALVWQGFPFFAVIILAGLQAIPGDLHEAAEIDGATRLQRFRHVVWPGLKGVILTALLLRTIWVANSLDVILVMTGGGPGYATHTLPLYAFLRAYSGMEFGYGSALAVVLTLFLISVAAFYVRRTMREAFR